MAGYFFFILINKIILNKYNEFKQFKEWAAVNDFQERITGIGILHNKQFHTIPLPENFAQIKFNAELVFKRKKGLSIHSGEKIICHADELLLELLVYTSMGIQPPPILSRITMKRVGRQMFPGINYNTLQR